MKNTLHKILQTGLVVAAVFVFINTVHAQTWTAPTGTAPSGNVPGPLNVGSGTQFKTGALGIGESTSTTAGTSTGYVFEVNGPTASNGVASFGDSYLTQFTHIGPVPTATTYTGATRVQLMNSSTVESASFGLLKSKSNTGIAGLFNTIGSTFADIFAPDKAYASLSGGLLGAGYPYVPDHSYEGPCYGNFCSSEQYCDAGTHSCQWISGGNGGTGNGWADGANSSTATFPSGKLPVLTAILSWSSITSAAPTIEKTVSTGGSETLYWSVAGASTCSIVSSNQTNNYNLPSGTGSGRFNLNSAGFAHGYHTINFSGATPGNYTYTLACEPAGATIGDGSITTTVTLTIGNKLMLQVNGNTQIQGYLLTDGVVSSNGGFVEQGSRVCLKNGNNCPAQAMLKPEDQGGSLELGGNNLVNSSNQIPYIDFHYGSSSASTDDFNTRIINAEDGVLRFNNKNDNLMWVGKTTGWSGGTYAGTSPTAVSGNGVIIENGLALDNANENTGINLHNGLTFGSNSGEGIAAGRGSATSNQWGLDFYTGGNKKMYLTNGGDLYITGHLYVNGTYRF